MSGSLLSLATRHAQGRLKIGKTLKCSLPLCPPAALQSRKGSELYLPHEESVFVKITCVQGCSTSMVITLCAPGQAFQHWRCR